MVSGIITLAADYHTDTAIRSQAVSLYRSLYSLSARDIHVGFFQDGRDFFFGMFFNHPHVLMGLLASEGRRYKGKCADSHFVELLNLHNACHPDNRIEADTKNRFYSLNDGVWYEVPRFAVSMVPYMLRVMRGIAGKDPVFDMSMDSVKNCLREGCLPEDGDVDADYVLGKLLPYRKRFLSEGEDTGVHEIVHIMDFGRSQRDLRDYQYRDDRFATDEDWEKWKKANYWKSPEEFNAYYQELLHMFEKRPETDQIKWLKKPFQVFLGNVLEQLDNKWTRSILTKGQNRFLKYPEDVEDNYYAPSNPNASMSKVYRKLSLRLSGYWMERRRELGIQN